MTAVSEWKGALSMKKAIIALVVLAAAGAALFFASRRALPLEAAAAAEARRDFPGALACYIEAIHDLTKSVRLPQKSRARTLAPEAWKAKVGDYLAVVAHPPVRGNESMDAVVAGVYRCTTHVENQNFATVKPDSALTEQAFTMLWEEIFFPDDVTDHGSHGELIGRAMGSNISILRVSSLMGYTYSASLLDLSSYKRTDFTLYPESSVSLLVGPGRYFLICSSEVEFPDGTLWRSAENIIPVLAPAFTSLKRMTVKSRVKRRM